ncbi:GNAT family N-acetyltransferase [Amycolatopsis keratiniphila]|uniref:GNAT family N-acetyltransferase n=1 Tax=Amycolatopsis keratiniphila TaxID=129921 RepID=UPI0022657DD9|nr:GNAT family N-acetyltransferase [Amycolatopsis keratiniphila]
MALRPVEDRDLDTLYELMRDPESVKMAAFIARDPDDREAFDRHIARLRTFPDLTLRAVTGDGRFLGTIGSFFVEGDAEITYWIDRAVWGRGVASRALALFLDVVEVRPLYARAASDNLGSLRVLRKAGFRVIGTEVAYASARDDEIEDTVLCLDV